MADVPISGLPAASSASGADLAALVQGGTTKQATITLLLNALSGASTATVAALTDTLAIIQSSTTKQVTVQHVLDAGSGASAITPALTDKVAAFTGGVSKTSTVQKILDAGAGATSVNAHLTDLILAFRSGAASSTTVQSLFDAIALLANASSPSFSDQLAIISGGVGKSIAFTSLPAATQFFNGLLNTSDKTLIDSANSIGNSLSLAMFSAAGGIHPKRLQVNGGSGSGLVMAGIWPVPISRTLTGGANTETLSITVPSGVFTTAPNFALIQMVNPAYTAVYQYSDGSNSTTNQVIMVRKNDGTNIIGGTYVMFGLWMDLQGTPV